MTRIETQPNLIFRPSSIVERLSPLELFPRDQPLEVELGCGDASFIVEFARQHPERNFIGVERLLGRLRKLDRKGRRLGLLNLRGVRLESAYVLEYLLPLASTSAVHVYFPDPWPKRRHWERRLVNERFPERAWRALVPGGVVYLRTDHPVYFTQMIEVFEADSRFRAVPTPAELACVITDFERGFVARGVDTRRAAYRRD